MPDLIAQGSQPEHRWRRSLQKDQLVHLGRSDAEWVTAWDDRVSRRHAEIVWQGDRLLVQRLADATNQIFFEGAPSDRFAASVGQHFVIGATTFTLVDQEPTVTLNLPRPVSQQAFTADYLKQRQFHNAAQRIDVLSRLPEIISGAGDDAELASRLVTSLMAGITHASAAAIVVAEKPASRILHWDQCSLATGAFQPSENLICAATDSEQSVVHHWEDPSEASGNFTVSAGIDWAFCTPVPGAACEGWALYIAGATMADGSTDEDDLRDDLKFAEMCATLLGNLRELKFLERRQAGLAQFFSAPVLAAIAGEDPNVVLAPRECRVSALFCDLRGFSRRSEQMSANLPELLARVSQALGVTTGEVLDKGGVIGDFHGDAAMGFWGWPLEQIDAPAQACRAALAIRQAFTRFAEQSQHPLADFQIGLGIATGQAVAGKIGTIDQVKVTAFGPVVNLASRLESLSGRWQAPVLIDGPTAEVVQQQMPASEARCRRVAVVRPFGIDTPVEVFELLPPESQMPQLADTDLAQYEAALAAFVEGRWDTARQLLATVPDTDRAKPILEQMLNEGDGQAPEDWPGYVILPAK